MAHIKAHQSLSFFRVELSIDFAKPRSIRSIDFFRIDAEGTSYHTFQFSCQVLTLSLEEFVLYFFAALYVHQAGSVQGSPVIIDDIFFLSTEFPMATGILKRVCLSTPFIYSRLFSHPIHALQNSFSSTVDFGPSGTLVSPAYVCNRTVCQISFIIR
jgi:hypothetical protein